VPVKHRATKRKNTQAASGKNGEPSVSNEKLNKTVETQAASFDTKKKKKEDPQTRSKAIK
jgi:hypothetical protein